VGDCAAGRGMRGCPSQYPLFSSPVWGIGPVSPALRRKKWD